jgi:hypothetical protein
MMTAAAYAQDDGEPHALGSMPFDPTKDPDAAKANKEMPLEGPVGDSPVGDLPPASLDHSPNMPPVGAQGKQGSCCAWAVGYYFKGFQEWVDYNWPQTDPANQMSPAFIFNMINTGTPNNGSHLNDAFRILKDIGVAPLSVCPYIDTDCTTWPSEIAFDCATTFRTDTGGGSVYYYIDCTEADAISTLKQVLFDNSCFVTSVKVYDNAFDHIEYFGNNFCINSTPRGDKRGGHAVCAVGYDDNRTTLCGRPRNQPSESPLHARLEGFLRGLALAQEHVHNRSRSRQRCITSLVKSADYHQESQIRRRTPSVPRQRDNHRHYGGESRARKFGVLQLLPQDDG